MNRLKSFMRNPFRELYDEAKLPNDIRRSLSLMVAGNLFSTIFGFVCGSNSSAMVGLATSMGATDMTFGILTAIGQASALMQIPFSMLVNRTHKRKKYMLTYGVISRALWMIFGFIPIIVPQYFSGINLQIWTIILLMTVISVFGASINVCWFPWLTDICPDLIRSRYLAIRNIILNITSVVGGMGVALILDHLPAEIKYQIVFAVCGLFGVIDMVCFLFCKEQFTAPPKKLHLGEVIKDIWKNQPFMRFMILWTAWNFTANMGGVYMTPYSMNVMGLTFTQVTLFGTIAGAVSSILVMNHWGRALHHYGNKNVMMVSCIGASLTPLFFLFSSPGNIWPMFLHNFIGAWFWSGCNLADMNMQMSYTPDDKRPSYIAIFACVTALVGVTLGSLAGGALLSGMENAHMFETGFMDRYKVLFLLEVVLRLGAVLLLVPKMEENTKYTWKDVVYAILRIKKRFRD